MAKFNFVCSAKAKLKIKVALIGNEAKQNQLCFKNFYKDNLSRQKQLIRQEHGTNLEIEREFANNDNDLNRAGGSTSLQIVSNKHAITRNSLYTKLKWKSLSYEHRRRK